MGVGLAVYLSLLVLVLFAAIALAIYFYFKLRGMKRANKGRVVNFDSNQAKGRQMGNLIEMEQGPMGRIKVRYMPDDIDLENRKIKDTDLEPVEVITEWNNLCIYPKGTFSKDTDIIFVLPVKDDFLPESVRKSTLGLGLIASIAKTDAERHELGIKEESYSRVKNLQFEGMPEFSNKFVKTYKDAISAFMKTFPDKEKKESSFTTKYKPST